MTTPENSAELFEKIAQDYEKQLRDASNQYQGAVMAANHEMESMILEWHKAMDSLAIKVPEKKTK